MPTLTDKQQHGRVREGRSKEDSHRAPGEVGVPLCLLGLLAAFLSVSLTFSVRCLLGPPLFNGDISVNYRILELVGMELRGHLPQPAHLKKPGNLSPRDVKQFG